MAAAAIVAAMHTAHARCRSTCSPGFAPAPPYFSGLWNSNWCSRHRANAALATSGVIALIDFLLH